MKSFLTFFCFLAILVAVFAASRSNYCNMDCSNHIGCNPNQNFAPHCSRSARPVEMTDTLKELIVDLHNEKRNFIAGGGDSNHPRACHMATMQWDDELAYLASLNVKQCEMQHDRCHNTDAFQFSGQNLHISMTTPPSNPDHTVELRNAVQSWFDEVKDSRASYIMSYPQNYRGPQIGHFTVMVADRNTHVGCAAASYVLGSASHYLVACNYATTNMIDHPIYTGCGPQEPKCKSKPNPRYPNLCPVNERYDVNKWF